MWTDNQSKASNYLSKKSVHIEMGILKNETSGQLPVDGEARPWTSHFEDFIADLKLVFVFFSDRTLISE